MTRGRQTEETALGNRRRISAIRAVTVGAGWRNYIFVLIDPEDGFPGLGEASPGPPAIPCGPWPQAGR